MAKTIKKVYCPKCGKELISLSAVETPREYGYRRITQYWCDTCDIDIYVTEHKEEK